MGRPRAPDGRQSGFTYMALLFAVAFMGVGLAITGIVWSTASKRAREQELLFVGEQFRRALVSYASAPASVRGQYPRELEELVRDPRFIETRRHLRKIYVDPMTGGREWGILREENGGIIGVHSLSQAAPIKVAGFPERYREFETAKDYTEWRFMHAPKPAQPGAAAPAAGQPAPGAASQ